jgi:hypothetical protein
MTAESFASGSAPSRALTVTPLWPRSRRTATGLTALIVLQTVLMFWATQRAFFFQDDYSYFVLAQERPFARYLLTPLFGLYPAPGARFVSFVLQKVTPLNLVVAQIVLDAFLIGTTIFLWQLVSTIAGSDRWWTVLLLVPFALSITLVVFPTWSALLPILPALLFAVAAISFWLRSYVDPRSVMWLGLTVAAIAAAGTFYMKFLLIPCYLLLLRVLVLPRLIGLPARIGDLWRERWRWVAVAAPPAVFLVGFVASGLAGRSAVSGSRPYLAYLVAAWFRAFVPATFLNARPNGTGPAIPGWVVVAAGQVLFFGIVAATWRRSAVALHGWAVFVLVFALNAAMVGTQRIATFGVDVAYALRYTRRPPCSCPWRWRWGSGRARSDGRSLRGNGVADRT